MAGTITLIGAAPLPEEPNWHTKRGLSKELSKTVGQTRNGALKVKGIAAVTSYAMDALYGLDEKRRALSGDDAGFNGVLGELEMGAARSMGSVVDGMYR